MRPERQSQSPPERTPYSSAGALLSFRARSWVLLQSEPSVESRINFRFLREILKLNPVSQVNRGRAEAVWSCPWSQIMSSCQGTVNSCQKLHSAGLSGRRSESSTVADDDSVRVQVEINNQTGRWVPKRPDKVTGVVSIPKRFYDFFLTLYLKVIIQRNGC